MSNNPAVMMILKMINWVNCLLITPKCFSRWVKYSETNLSFLVNAKSKLDVFLKLKLFRAISCNQLTTFYLYFDSFKLLDKPELYENLKIIYSKAIKKIPKKIKNGW